MKKEDISNAIDGNYFKGPDKHGQRTLIKIGNIDQKGHNSLWGRVYNPEGLSSGLNAKGGGLGAKTGLYDIGNMRIRRLTPVECERLQGFPDNWTEGISDTQRYKCLGNAVTTTVIKAIGERLIKSIYTGVRC